MIKTNEQSETAYQLCRCCNKEKEIAQFYRNRAKKNGRDSRCRDCSLRQGQEWRQRNPERQYSNDVKRKYGVKEFDYGQMLFSQGGGCAICGALTDQRQRHKFLSVDHCHRTGKIRALLCNLCNVGIGAFGDDVNRLIQAAAYLQRHGGAK